MRLFIAILFPEDVLDRMCSLRDELHDQGRGSYSSRDNLHLTLAFLGECSQEEERLAEEALDSISFEPFTLCFDRTGFFSRPDGDIWWIGAEESPSLMRLERDIRKALSERGFSLEKRRFRPHVTLGRRVMAKMSPRRIEPISFAPHAVSLMLSERGEGQMIYTPLYEISGSSNQHSSEGTLEKILD